MQEAKFYKILNNNRLQCQLCNHYCAIENNKVGSCNARLNKNKKLYSLVYGYPIAMNEDPIEKKPLFHFLPGSLTFSFGTLGCNFSCANCQNHDISQVKNIMQKTEIMDYIDPEKIVEQAISYECRSISYTYNEPTIFCEYALDVMKMANENNLKNVWVSNGFMSEKCLEAIIPYLDAINIDLKSMDNDFYENNCKARLKPVLKNLVNIKKEGIHLEITTLIIPSLTDDSEMISQIAEFIAGELDIDVPWHLSKFSPEISWKLKNIPKTGDDLVYQAYEIGKDAGLKYVYVGNMPGDQKENTYCSKCGELGIRRMGYHIERLDNQGRCSQCDKSLDIFE